MKKLWNYVLTSKVNHFWFALSCLVLLCVSVAVKSKIGSIVQVFDETVAEVCQPLPQALLPTAERTATAMARTIP